MNGKGITLYYISINMDVLPVNEKAVKHIRTSDMLRALNESRVSDFVRWYRLYIICIIEYVSCLNTDVKRNNIISQMQ
jgi:hypothetical protein